MCFTLWRNKGETGAKQGRGDGQCKVESSKCKMKDSQLASWLDSGWFGQIVFAFVDV